VIEASAGLVRPTKKALLFPMQVSELADETDDPIVLKRQARITKANPRARLVRSSLHDTIVWPVVKRARFVIVNSPFVFDLVMRLTSRQPDQSSTFESG
jgi:hypothetical protein